MENQKETTLEKLGKSIKQSVTLKLLSIGILILLLLIPVAQIKNLISERELYKVEAIREVSNKWGGSQTIAGPILTIPYKTYSTDSKNKVYEYIHYAHFLPTSLDIHGQINPEIRKRGIYEIPLYNTRIKISGKYQTPNFKSLKIDPKDVVWEDAIITVGIPDMNGIKDIITLKWNDSTYSLEPSTSIKDIIPSGVSSSVRIAKNQMTSFEININLNGSENLSFVPVGKKTKVLLRSTWKDPSFNGQFIPDSHTITDDGFSAEWNVFDFNRNYPQQWTDAKYNIYASAFGVNLFMPINHYQKNMRSAKYSILIISLTFLVYFFFEILNHRKIHPFQYFLVGLSLSLFYTLLLSITEHLGFDLAYAIASTMTIVAIIGYSSAIFKQTRLTLLLGSFLTLIYVFIYVILQLQDYSLLVGSIGLFAVLVTTMYLSRKIDWYALSGAKS